MKNLPKQRMLVAFSLFSSWRNGLILENAHNVWFIFWHNSFTCASNVRVVYLYIEELYLLALFYFLSTNVEDERIVTLETSGGARGVMGGLVPPLFQKDGIWGPCKSDEKMGGGRPTSCALCGCACSHCWMSSARTISKICMLTCFRSSQLLQLYLLPWHHLSAHTAK